MKNGVHLVTNEINRLVYSLYELPDDEVRIIEPPAVDEVTARRLSWDEDHAKGVILHSVRWPP